MDTAMESLWESITRMFNGGDGKRNLKMRDANGEEDGVERGGSGELVFQSHPRSPRFREGMPK